MTDARAYRQLAAAVLTRALRDAGVVAGQHAGRPVAEPSPVAAAQQRRDVHRRYEHHVALRRQLEAWRWLLEEPAVRWWCSAADVSYARLQQMLRDEHQGERVVAALEQRLPRRPTRPVRRGPTAQSPKGRRDATARG